MPRADTRVIPEDDESTDLRLLLAQSRPAADGRLRDDTILVAFTASAPANAEDDVAREHGLELVDRTDLPALGMRIARYRVRDGRPMAAVVAVLRTDQRVRQAQGNYEYRPVPPTAPATDISGLKDRPAEGAKPDRLGMPPPRPADRRTAAIDKAVQKPAAQPNAADAAGAGKTARLSKDDRGNASIQPPRIAKVADVLAGGL